MFVGTFYEEELQKVNQEELRMEMVIKRKGDKSHIK